MHSLWLVSVFLHLLAAATWIGGMVFLVAVVLPAIRNHPERAQLLHATGLRFRTVGWVVLVILLVTGLFQLHMRGASLDASWWRDTQVGQLSFWKLVTFLVIGLLSGVHDFFFGVRATRLMMTQPDHPDVVRYKLSSRWLGRLNLLLALLAAAIGVMIVRGMP